MQGGKPPVGDAVPYIRLSEISYVVRLLSGFAYHVAFGENFYSVVTAATTSTFRYELIDALAESQDYIILLMKKRYVQPLDKRTLTGGTVEEFKRFLEEKTGKTFRRMK